MISQPERLTAALAGRYRIERELGAGGMATVFLAQDLKHDRKVAIKVLKPELAAVLGAERFVQEIKTTAALSHPHILPLFDSGEADGFLYYVMPFIQGETIREKLNRETQFGIDEAVKIAREVADALDYAHRNGVIHRDIKPENILLHDTRPMVMDFGIALAVSAAAGGRMTETGLSLGTPHYMSPEQATADKEITARSDVYSLASVLYEMLAGQPPHLGGSAQQIIMKIVTDTPRPVTELRKTVPPNVAAALSRALEKLPADRFESAKAFGDALANPSFATAGAMIHTATGADARWRTRFVVLAVVSVLAAGAAIAAGRRVSNSPAVPTTYLDLALGGVVPSGNSDVVISPDGSLIAVAGLANGERAVFLRRLDADAEFRKIPGTETADGSPSFSPDSRWIAFRRTSDSKLVKIPVSGGSATPLAQLARTIFPAVHWGTDDQLVYRGGTIGPVLVSANGGAPDSLGLEGADRTTFLLPNGSGLLYSRLDSLFLLDFRTDSSTLLRPFGIHPTYVASGHILYIAENGGLTALPFDLARHRITGPPATITERVAANRLVRGYSVSTGGALVYHDGASRVAAGSVWGSSQLVVVTFGGAADTLRLPRGARMMPRFSPDGRSIAYEFASGNATDTDLYTFDLVTGTNTRITFSGDNDDPIWSPDGTRIAFTKRVPGSGEDIFMKPADNSSGEQTLLTRPGNQNPLAWLPNDTIVFVSNESGQDDLFIMSSRSGDKPSAYLQAPWREDEMQVSPDGKLAAFASTEGGGLSDVWIREFPVPRGKWQVSSNQISSSPRWSRDGRYVYFWRMSSVETDTLYRARIDRTPALVVRAPEVVLSLDVITPPEHWDLHPDGKRMIAAVPDALGRSSDRGGAASRYLIALNWFGELRARAGNRRASVDRSPGND